MSFKKTFFIITFLAVGFLVFNINTQAAKAATVEEILAKISQLQAQIAELQKQLIEMRGEVWCYDFKLKLRYGDRGDEVKALQTVLTKEGFEVSGDDAGNFGEYTASALVGFQEKYRDEILTPWKLLRGTGNVGKYTIIKLNKLYGCGVIATTTPEPTTQTPIPVTPIEILPACKTLWYYDNDHQYCQQGKFCGAYMYLGLRTFATEAECKAALPGQKFLTVLSPNGREQWEIGKTYSIKWRQTQEANISITLQNKQLVEGYSPYFKMTITSNYPGKPADLGSTWAPSNNLNPHTGYEICVSGYFNQTLFEDCSDAPFTITSTPVQTCIPKGNSCCLGDNCVSSNVTCLVGATPVFKGCNPDCNPQWECQSSTTKSITVLYPNGGENWQKGSAQIIKWNSSNVSKVYIKLRKGSDTYPGAEGLVSNIIANAGYFKWIIPTNLPDGSDYAIRVIDETGTALDDSDNFFSLVTNVTNLPPVIDGLDAPTQLKVNQTGTWTIKAHDPEQGSLNYQVKWGDEGVFASYEQKAMATPSVTTTQTTTFTHSYSNPGTYTIEFTVTDNNQKTAKTSTTVNVTVLTTCSQENQFCGGFAGKACCSGLTCKLDGNYPDAGGTCVKTGCRDQNSACTISDTPCCSGLKKVSLTFPSDSQCIVATCGSICRPCGNGVCDSNENTCNCPEDCKKSITLTSPNGGEQWQAGKTYDITWKSSGIGKINIYLTGSKYPGGVVSVECLRVAGAKCEGLCANLAIAQDINASLGKYSWTIPNNQELYSDARISIQEDVTDFMTETCLSDSSDNYFSITRPCVGEGETQPIGSNLQCCSGLKFITKSGYDSNCIPSPAAEFTCIKCGDGICGSSENKCNCPEDCKKSITVISPNGGEQWEIGQPYDIKWNKTGLVGNYVKIELYKDNYLYMIIISSTENDGIYSLTIPNYTTSGSNFKIKIIDNSDLTVSDFSDNYFSIASATVNKWCKDSDNGQDYYVKGECPYYNVITGSGGTAIDSCYGNTLTECFCESDEPKIVNYNCPNGCQDGVCKSELISVPTGATPIVGGECSYKSFKGQCAISSISSDAQTIGFKFSPTEALNLTDTGWIKETDITGKEWQEYPGYIGLNCLTGKYPIISDDLSKCNIKVGAIFGCNISLITKGTCSPTTFDFDENPISTVSSTTTLKNIEDQVASLAKGLEKLITGLKNLLGE